MKKIPITSEDREMLKSIYSNDGCIDLYALYEKYQLSPGQLSRLTRKFISLNVVTENDGVLYLTEEGKSWLLNNKAHVFCDIDKHWKKCPEHWIGPKIDINEKYQPNFDKIDRLFFRELIEK